MKRTLSILLLCASCLGAQASPAPSFERVPNYMTRDRCDPFSQAALRYLHKQGVPAVRILYGWSGFGASGYHAAVLFQWEGKFYFMDNWRQKPRRVASQTDLGAVNHITGQWNTHCWMTDENCERVAPRKLADLFAQAPESLAQLQERLRR